NVMLTVSVFLYISLLYVVSLLFLFFLFFLVLRRPPSSTLFPYTTPSDLIWLGIRTIRTRNAEMTLQAPGPSNGAFRQGILTEVRSEEHTSELQSRFDLVCRLLLEKKKTTNIKIFNNITNITMYVIQCQSH